MAIPTRPEVESEDVPPPPVNPLNDFVRRNPLGALVGAVMIGALLGKLVISSAARLLSSGTPNDR
jgi:hypothetical protein